MICVGGVLGGRGEDYSFFVYVCHCKVSINEILYSCREGSFFVSVVLCLLI